MIDGFSGWSRPYRGDDRAALLARRDELHRALAALARKHRALIDYRLAIATSLARRRRAALLVGAVVGALPMAALIFVRCLA